jgi:2-keto-4-pentenoate hydratase/2-oxohepta-3-ene-1,7-dioic acid hydratase in catechol pathway
MSTYRLVTFNRDKQKVTGLLIDGLVYSIADACKYFDITNIPTKSLLSIFEDWHHIKDLLKDLVERVNKSSLAGVNVSEVKLETPLQYPQALYCAGANYVDHLEEMTGKKPNKKEMQPFFFLKPPRSTLVGTNATVAIPEYTQQLDWEAEIALVIGKEARQVNAECAMDYVAGFTILNDLSARDLMKRFDVPFLFDWIGQKCFPGSAPTGPWITPKEAIDDPNNLDIKLWVNDILYQDSNSNQMIFTHAELIENLSKHVTLYPGDIIATGTPAGVGHGKGVYLRDGDVIRIEIAGLGELTTFIKA